MTTHDTDQPREIDDADEPEPEPEPEAGDADEPEPEAGEAGDAIALGPVDPDDERTERTDDEPGDRHAAASGTDDAGADDDGSVLLTETEPGSVLPPEEPEEPEELEHLDDLEELEPEAFDEPEQQPAEVAEPEPGPTDVLEPVGPDAAVDPGTGTYQERWRAIQGTFVDEPHRAVESAGALVAQMWHELERSIAEQREALDNGWTPESTTDDLRTAFKEYRALFTRLTTLLAPDTPR